MENQKERYQTIERVFAVLKRCKTQTGVLKALIKHNIDTTSDYAMRRYVMSFMATLPER